MAKAAKDDIRKNFRLTIDDREKGFDFAKMFTDYDVTVERMAIGDFKVSYRGLPILIIERKTWNDLAASIKDGRLTSQIEAMLALREKGIRVVILIEGAKRAQHGHVSADALDTKIDHIILRHEIPVVYSSGHDGTAARVERLISHFPVDTIDKIATIQGGFPDTEVKLERKADSAELVAIKCLSNMKGVSEQAAMILLTRYSIADLFSASVRPEHIKDLQYPSGTRVGDARAVAIIDRLFTYDGRAEIISGLSGISRDTADKIARLDKLDEDTVAEVSLGSRRLGHKVAERLINAIHLKIK